MGALFASFFMVEEHVFKIPIFILLFLTFFSGYLYTEFQYSKQIRKILALNLFVALVCIFLIISNHHAERLFKISVIIGLGLLYNSRFLRYTIREIPFLKVFYVGFIWGLMNAWLCFEQFNLPIFWLSFFFISSLLLPFEIRDMEEDRGNVCTFPLRFGIRKTKIFACFLATVSLVFALFYLEDLFLFAFILTYLTTVLLIAYSRPRNNDMYFSVLVESCSGLPILIVLLLNLLI